MTNQKTLLSITNAALTFGYKPDLDPRCYTCEHGFRAKCAVMYAYEMALALPGDEPEAAEAAERVLSCLIRCQYNCNPQCQLYAPRLRPFHK